MKFTTPCFVCTEDAEKRKELIQWLYEIAGRQFDEDEIFRDCEILACDEKWFWLADASAVFDGFIDSGTDLELFKALAAMTDDNDMNQWFIVDHIGGPDEMVFVDREEALAYVQSGDGYRKATTEEIIERFR